MCVCVWLGSSLSFNPVWLNSKDTFGLYNFIKILLGSIFSNLYLSPLENKVFDTINKPDIDLRYADEILLLINCTDEIDLIQEIFQNDSVLNFTQEININNKIPFVGVLIETSNIDRFTTSAYKIYLPTLIPAPLISIVTAAFSYKRTLKKHLISGLNYNLPLKLFSLTNLKI